VLENAYASLVTAEERQPCCTRGCKATKRPESPAVRKAKEDNDGVSVNRREHEIQDGDVNKAAKLVKAGKLRESRQWKK
jgi:hypothetical protein